MTMSIWENTNNRNECIQDLKKLSKMTFINPGMVRFLKENCGDKALKDATKKLSLSEAKFLSTKLMEAAFESGPQFILQLAIILKVGNVEGHQVSTMLVGLITFWISTTKFCLQMPTKKTPLREPNFTDFAVTFIPSMIIILSRFAAWSFLLAYLGYSILMPIAVAFAYMIAVHWKTLDFTKESDIVEVCASILVPCITKDEYSEFYQSGSAVTATVLMSAISCVMLMSPTVESGPPILTCFEPENWSPTTNDIRCQYNSKENRITQLCINRLLNFGLGFGFDEYRTICHDSQPDGIKQGMVYRACGILLGVLSLSQLLSTYCIQPLLDPLVRLKLLGTWNEFYETGASNVQDTIQSQKDAISCDAWKGLLASALDDNIDSLVLFLLECHGDCSDCGKGALLKQAYKKCSANKAINRAIEKAVGENLSMLNQDEYDIDGTHPRSVLTLVPLDLKHCQASMDLLRKQLKTCSMSTPEEGLLKMIMQDDVTNFNHFVNCHKHLCTKLIQVCSTVKTPIVTRDQLAEMIKLPQRLENEAFEMPDSKVSIQLKYHKTSTEEMMLQVAVANNVPDCIKDINGSGSDCSRMDDMPRNDRWRKVTESIILDSM